VLLWICCRYKDGKEIHEPPLNELITVDFKVCLKEKLAYLERKLASTTSYEPYWKAVIDLLNWSIDHRNTTRRRQMLDPTAPEEEPTIEQVIEIYRNILEKRGFRDLSEL
jgi:hypothetical protein